MRQNTSYVVTLLPLLGCWTFHVNAYKEYFLIKETKTWDDARAYCREKFTDLAVIGSHDDTERMKSVSAAAAWSGEAWFGLKKNGAMTWLWSVGETLVSKGQVTYTNWEHGFPSTSHLCGGMRPDGKWLSGSCGEVHPFVCQQYKGSSEMYFVLQNLSWRAAQSHCRLNNSDLASARNEAENQLLQNIINAVDPSVPMVWTGLFMDMWNWTDQSQSSFRNWESSQPNNDGDCALYHTTIHKWWDRPCTYPFYFYCYGVTTKRWTVRLEIKSNTLDFNAIDSAATKNILNQIQSHLGAKLQWLVQPDGKIFQKKKKKMVVEGCQDLK